MIFIDSLVSDDVRSVTKLKAVVANTDVRESYFRFPCDPPSNHSGKFIRYVSWCDEPAMHWFMKIEYADGVEMC